MSLRDWREMEQRTGMLTRAGVVWTAMEDQYGTEWFILTCTDLR